MKMSENGKPLDLGQYGHSPVLFLDDTGNSLTFVIKPCRQKEALREMIEYGGGELVTTPGDHGVTFIPPDVDLIGDDDVYSTDYIKECCTRNKVLNLKDFRLNKESRFPEDFDVMDVFLRYTSWPNVRAGLPFERSFFVAMRSSPSNSSFYDEDDLDSCVDAYSDSHFGLISLHKMSPARPLEASDNIPAAQFTNADYQWSDDDNSIISTSKRRIQNEESHGTVTSPLKSKNEQEELISISRSSSSPHKRRKKDDDQSDASSSSTVIKRRKDNYKSDSTNSSPQKHGKSKDEDHVKQESTSSFFKSTALRSSKLKASRKVQSSSSDEVETSEDEELWKNTIPKARVKPARRDYIEAERKSIVSFIVKHQCHSYVKGREMWQKAEAARICPGRTWQSMKEHFIKKIMPNIKTYKMPSEELEKFQKPFR